MDNKKVFTASSELFSGYEVVIDLNNCSSINDIINIFVVDLQKCLEQNKFIVLLEKLQYNQFHIHNYTFEDILNSQFSAYYICDHC